MFGKRTWTLTNLFSHSKRALGTESKPDTHSFLKAGFSEAKNWYEKYGTMTSSKLYSEYIPFMKMNEANSVLETGSGPGNGVPIILSSVRPSCQVIATDISPGFLGNLSNIKADNYSSREANIEALPFVSNSFDRYISNMAIHNADNPQTAFQEAFRVLRPDGILGVSTFGGNDETNTYMALMKKFRRFINLPYHDSILSSLALMGFPEPFRKFALDIGFKRVIAYSLYTVYPFTTPEEAADLYLSFGPLVHFMKANPDKASELQNLVMQELHECMVVKGKPVGYEATILVAFK